MKAPVLDQVTKKYVESVKEEESNSPKPAEVRRSSTITRTNSDGQTRRMTWNEKSKRYEYRSNTQLSSE